MDYYFIEKSYHSESVLPYKLKIPLCLGTLLSHYHVLTIKNCLGEYLSWTESGGFQETWQQTERCNKNRILYICFSLKYLLSSFKSVMLWFFSKPKLLKFYTSVFKTTFLKKFPESLKVKVGDSVNYEYPTNEGPTGNANEIRVTEYDQYIDVKTITPYPHDNFCLLTLKTYVDFNTKVAPLCLPEINNNHYDRKSGGKISAFGYPWVGTELKWMKILD